MKNIAQTSSSNSPPAEQPELRRALRNRHIQMIALGGAIGTGLFYGSTYSISLAGPAVLLTYLVGRAVIYLVMRALGEISVDEPVSGAFAQYAYRNWSDPPGSISGWNYWFNYVLVAMAELSVVRIYVQYWFPSVPAWLTAAFRIVAITAVNLIGVRAFGEFESWFALIKVLAVLGIQGDDGLSPPSFSHLWNQGEFFPHGLTEAVMALVVVMFSFGGVELIGIAAREADDPTRTVPRAINQVIYRILIFNIGSLAVNMAVVPWESIDGELSPLVQIFDSVGIRFAAHILNFVVLTAALSVYNSGL